jgi:hypothetical protein
VSGAWYMGEMGVRGVFGVCGEDGSRNGLLVEVAKARGQGVLQIGFVWPQP